MTRYFPAALSTRPLEEKSYAAIAVQQNQWLAFTALKVVEANAFYFDEFPHWRVFTFGLLRS
jgi:hypothetical protein